MSAASASRGSRWFVAAGVGFLVAFQAAALAGLPRTALAVLGVHGFVVHVLLGKANALVPTYFDRDLAFPRAAFLALPSTTLGAAALSLWAAGFAATAAVGAALWAAGVAVSLATLAWTIRGNLSGAATATGEHNAHRRQVDRAANAAVPVALAYLAAGTYETVAAVTSLPTLAAAGLPGAVHLVAAGGALVLLFAVGFRLLPRFLVASPPRALVAVVLPTGALAPALLVAGFGGGPLFHAGAALEAVAVAGFAGAYVALYARSDRSRVGFHGVLAGVLSGVVGVLLGLGFATGMLAPTAGRVLAHLRLNVLGLLGLSIVGVTYQFYPPTVGVFPGSDDRTALASILLLAGGLWVEAGGRLTETGGVARLGVALGLVGALAYAYLVASAFRARATK
ncbi:hypothetical protein [Halobacterium wangiae]|uniref:hypothetical protein n=1 Tax=Halobacterium wangiae TaxID=2902623 RepID=UPI001E484FD7|nr:hypothetical protein [Halobacterium wangiae]